MQTLREYVNERSVNERKIEYLSKRRKSFCFLPRVYYIRLHSFKFEEEWFYSRITIRGSWFLSLFVKKKLSENTVLRKSADFPLPHLTTYTSHVGCVIFPINSILFSFGTLAGIFIYGYECMLCRICKYTPTYTQFPWYFFLLKEKGVLLYSCLPYLLKFFPWSWLTSKQLGQAE